MKNIFFCFLLSACAWPLAAQNEQIDTFAYRQSGENIFFFGVKAKNQAEFSQLQLFDAMYPVSIVPRPVLQRVISIGNRQSILADSLTKISLRLEQQNKLSELEIEKYQKIIEYQKQFIAFSDSTNQMLNKSIGALNLQLNECRQVATDCSKSQSSGKLWAILIGGGIGLGLGVLLGVAVN